MMPVDNPLWSEERSWGRSGSAPLARFYPDTPIIVADMTAREVRTLSRESEQHLAILHEIAHVNQIKMFVPLRLALLDLIRTSFFSPVLFRGFREKLERVRRTFAEWGPFLEGDCVLRLVTCPSLSADARRRLLRTAMEQGDDDHRNGLEVILGSKGTDEEAVWRLVEAGELDCLLDRVFHVVNVAAFVKRPTLSLEGEWRNLSSENVARLAADVLFSGDNLRRLEPHAEALERFAARKWDAFAGRLSMRTDTGGEASAIELLARQLLDSRRPVFVPVFVRDGCTVARAWGGGDEQVDDFEATGLPWLTYAAAVEVAGGERPLSCPVYKIMEGRPIGLCGRQPSLEWCTLACADQDNLDVDISARARECEYFWTVVELAFKHQLRALLTRGGEEARPVGNKSMYRRQPPGKAGTVHSGVFTLETVLAPEVDRSGGRGVTLGEAAEVVKKLPGSMLSRKDKKRLLGLLRGWPSRMRFNLVPEGDGFRQVASKEELFLYLVGSARDPQGWLTTLARLPFWQRLVVRFHCWRLQKQLRKVEQAHGEGRLNWRGNR